jgi:hypothetical protein
VSFDNIQTADEAEFEIQVITQPYTFMLLAIPIGYVPTGPELFVKETI